MEEECDLLGHLRVADDRFDVSVQDAEVLARAARAEVLRRAASAAGWAGSENLNSPICDDEQADAVATLSSPLLLLAAGCRSDRPQAHGDPADDDDAVDSIHCSSSEQRCRLVRPRRRER